MSAPTCCVPHSELGDFYDGDAGYTPSLLRQLTCDEARALRDVSECLVDDDAEPVLTSLLVSLLGQRDRVNGEQVVERGALVQERDAARTEVATLREQISRLAVANAELGIAHVQVLLERDEARREATWRAHQMRLLLNEVCDLRDEGAAELDGLPARLVELLKMPVPADWQPVATT